MVCWRFITDATDKAKARKVLDRILATLNREPHQTQIEPYHKGGFAISFATACCSGIWSELVVDVLATAQLVGHGWHLSGSITESIDACCNKSSIAGVTFIHVVCSCVRQP
jgi:hypothetical protein